MKRHSPRRLASPPTTEIDNRQRPDIEANASTDSTGNKLEFSSVYGTWQPRVRRWVRSLGAPACDIDDVTQEVFIIVRRKLSAFHSGNLAGWLYRITERTVRDYRRKSRVRHARRGSAERLEWVPSREDLHGLYEMREAVRRVMLSLSRMSGAHRETFVQFALHGLSGEEIAALHEVPIATVWSRIHRARKALTRSLRGRVGRRRAADRDP